MAGQRVVRQRMNASSSIHPTDAHEFCASCMKALADRTRLAVVQRLLQGPMNVSDLAASLDVEQSLLSHHLRVLRDCGIVAGERGGRHIRYCICPTLHDGDGLDFGCCTLKF